MNESLIAWAHRLRAWYASLGRYGRGAVRVLDRWIEMWRKEKKPRQMTTVTVDAEELEALRELEHWVRNAGHNGVDHDAILDRLDAIRARQRAFICMWPDCQMLEPHPDCPVHGYTLSARERGDGSEP